MQNIVNFLNQGWVGVVIGLIGLAAAYLFYRRSLNRQQLVFKSDTIHVVGKSHKFPSKLRILYGDREVEEVVKTSIILWNAGNVTLANNQIIEADPLRIELGNRTELLDVDVAKVSREVNAFTANISPNKPNTIDINFDFLDPEDGAFIRILHTKTVEFEIKGTLRGLPSGITSLGTYRPASFIEIFRNVILVSIGIWVTMLIGFWLLGLLGSYIATLAGLIVVLIFETILIIRKMIPKMPRKVVKWYENVDDY